jgi:hypothetical protein
VTDFLTEATVQRVKQLTRAEGSIMTDSATTALGCSRGLAYSAVHDRLKFRKVCSRWVPREMDVREKMNRMGLTLRQYADEREYMLKRIVTGDKSWVHHCQP